MRDYQRDTQNGRSVVGHARLTQPELAARWRVSGRTLEKWRQARIGPPHLKIGGRVVYRLEDIEAFEAEQLRGPA
ncbi:helix-turn-helix transcriptional regulator [Roseomonas rosulenta]|uniref:helix-turn-helix transcriptional regulator n=1 Tax=Roseomonas rosulenta TaxID=2748667 RepID=UPI0018E01223|nr:helix-turn-helix domain-containing protein [Roseomonas rosulenta]